MLAVCILAVRVCIAASMIKREADFSIVFRHWLRANPQYSCALEMKQTSKPSIAFSAVEENQLIYLQAIHSDKGALIRVQGTNGEPDYVYLRNAPTYVVIKFPGEFHMIGIETFLLERKRSSRKSLTNMRAREISTVSVKLKTKTGVR